LPGRCGITPQNKIIKIGGGAAVWRKATDKRAAESDAERQQLCTLQNSSGIESQERWRLRQVKLTPEASGNRLEEQSGISSHRSSGSEVAANQWRAQR